MPELPEVETVKRILEELIINKTISNIDIFYDRLIQSDLKEFKEKIINQKIISLSRLGKYLFINLTNDLVIISHLRMEGKYRYVKNGNPRNKHTTCIFSFDDGTFLSYDDSRKFGVMYLTNTNNLYDVPMIKKLGKEGNKLEINDFYYLKTKLNKNKKIKELLLDQSIISGIGNIYADEILYSCKINPFTKGKDLADDDIKNIIINAKVILNKAIELGGSTIHSFHPSEGVDGRFQSVLLCYGKEGEKCPTCGSKFKKTFLGGRGTTFCPNCQINKENEKAIGITGQIGSGKSTVLNYLKTKGYFILSADDIVHDLYKDPLIKKKLSNILKTDFDYYDDNKRTKITQILNENKILKEKLEDYIFPMVENEFLKHLNKHEKVAYEVPLLFKAHFEYMFKKIIILKINESNQLSNLNKRNEKNVNEKITLNNASIDYKLQNNKIRIIENNGTLADLYNKIEDILNEKD